MQFLCIKHEHSCISFKNNVSSIQIFKYYVQISFILTITWDSCDFCTNLGKQNFTQKLDEPMKPSRFMM